MQNEDINPVKTLEQIVKHSLDRRYIDLTPEEAVIPQVVANKLLTTLLDYAKRDPWEDERCRDIRNHVAMLSLPGLDTNSMHACKAYLADQEKNRKTFFGSDISDDSDSDEENEYRQKNRQERELHQNAAKRYRDYAQMLRIRYKKKSGNFKYDDLKINTEPSEIFDLKERRQIHFGEDVIGDKVDADLGALNALIADGMPLNVALERLRRSGEERKEKFTNFYVAQYRGITYTTTKWDSVNRRAHRADRNEINAPQYCASVYESVGLSLYSNYTETKRREREEKEALREQADVLREILLVTREAKPCEYKSYTYRAFAYVLQNVYTEDYHGFKQFIQSDERLKSLFMNDAIPFVSMADNPYHAAKYAYGLKAYRGHEDEILSPNWRSDGRAERPYSGVVYVSLHPIDDYNVDGPLHLITLNRNAEIKLKAEMVTIAEHETCFPSYLPEDRVIHKHIAKYPSFKRVMKGIVCQKYGLDKDDYEKFRKGLLENQPHTDKYNKFKTLLGEALCSYQEVRLIDIARMEAERRGGVLIYRGVAGQFSREMPYDSVGQRDNAVDQADRQRVKAKKARRKQMAKGAHRVKELVGDENIKRFYDSCSLPLEIVEPPTVLMRGNTVSLPLAWMVNAVLNHRHYALARMLAKEVFRAELNNTFNTEDLENATLLHLAAGIGNNRAVELILSVTKESLLCKARLISGQDASTLVTPADYALHRGFQDLEANLKVEGLLAGMDHLSV